LTQRRAANETVSLRLYLYIAEGWATSEEAVFVVQTNSTVLLFTGIRQQWELNCMKVSKRVVWERGSEIAISLLG
jgi:hypothetical protein